MTTVDFCPAAACAADVVRLETRIDALDRQALAAPPSLDQRRELETLSDQLRLEADAARTRLSEVDPGTALGAVAQLLAAIRDVRVSDDAERDRARRLEARARRFLASNGLLDAAFCRQLSQTRLPPPGSAPRPLAASE